jgi:hypothetical protein
MDNYGTSSLAPMPLHVMLAHELIHADRAMRGISIPAGQRGSVSLEVERTFNPGGVMPATRSVTHRRLEQEELATIGLGSHHTLSCVTENMIRLEQGFNIRTSHRGEYRRW